MSRLNSLGSTIFLVLMLEMTTGCAITIAKAKSLALYQRRANGHAHPDCRRLVRYRALSTQSDSPARIRRPVALLCRRKKRADKS